MSATIGDPADLARRLGTRPIVKLPLDAAHADRTFGRRLMVLNPDDSGDLPERISGLGIERLCASARAARADR